MKKLNKGLPVLALAAAILLSAVLVIGAAAAPRDPFLGAWHSIDIDGSSQTLHIGGGPGSSYHVRYVDDGATVCAADQSIGASASGFLTASGSVLSGNMPVLCLTSPSTFYADHYFQFIATGGMLVQVEGSGNVTWFR